MSDELMNDKEAANTIMFLFLQLDCYEREYFLCGLDQREDFIFNSIKYYFDPIHIILTEDEDYQGSYHWAEYDDDQKNKLKKICDLFVTYFCKNEGNDYLDQIIFDLSGAVRLRWDQAKVDHEE